MKRIWIAVGILFTTIILCFLEVIYISNMTKNFYEQLDLIKSLAGTNKDEAINLADQTLSQWQEKNKVLAIFITHERLEEIDELFSVIPVDLRQEGDENFLMDISKLYSKFEYLNETELPSVRNIL